MPSPEILARLRLNALARRLTPQLASRYLAAVQAIRDAVELESLAQRLQAGDVDGALRALLGPDAVPALNSIGDGARDAVRASATAWGADPVAIPGAGLSGTVAGQLAGEVATVTVRLGFDPVHPAVIAALAEQRRAAIVGATQSIAAGARVTVIDAVERTTRAGLNPKVAAREIRDVLGLNARDAEWIASYRRQLEQLDPIALTRELRDGRYDRTLRKALSRGTPLTPEQVDAQVNAYERGARQNSAETAARSSALDAARQGQKAVWDAAIADGRFEADDLEKTWHTTLDGRERLGHRLLNKVTIPYNDQWFDASTDEYRDVPGGFNCRCSWTTRPVLRGPTLNPRPTAAPGEIRGGFAEVERAARRRAA